MEDRQYFAHGLDRGPRYETRQIKTLATNAGLLLESRLLLDLPGNHRTRYIEGLVRTIFSDEFLTSPGVRLRAKRHLKLVSFADYHGCQVSWPKQTYDIAKGLRNHGLAHLAEFLETRILDSVSRAGEFYEFFFVNGQDGVKYHYRTENPEEPTYHDFGAANQPDAGQAWTISAVLAIVAARHSGKHDPSELTVSHLEANLFNQPIVQSILTDVSLKPRPSESSTAR